MFRLFAAIALALCTSVPARATTYPPVTFTDLVTQADVIFIGEVVDVRPLAVNTADGAIIKTRVVFRVNDPLFGTTAALEVMEFFGGELGDVGMAIAEMPRFAIGDRRVVFARRDRSINPIVGFTQGLLRVTRDANGVDRVLTLEGLPVDQPESIGLGRTGRTAVTAMRLLDFRDRVRRAVDGIRR